MAFKSIFGAIGTGLAVVSLNASATLIGVLPATPGGNDYLAYYDDVADLTWLANANAGGATMNWVDANAWAAGLDVAGVTGWRLPGTVQPDASCGIQGGGISSGYNCTGSEMGNLFYSLLGGAASSSITTTHNANYDLFNNVQSGYYWSATEYATNTNAAWFFGTGNGLQNGQNKDSAFFSWAVQSGNASVVPVPAAVWLFGSGLIGLAGVARRKARA